jgi:hypothetical protein
MRHIEAPTESPSFIQQLDWRIALALALLPGLSAILFPVVIVCLPFLFLLVASLAVMFGPLALGLYCLQKCCTGIDAYVLRLGEAMSQHGRQAREALSSGGYQWISEPLFTNSVIDDLVRLYPGECGRRGNLA